LVNKILAASAAGYSGFEPGAQAFKLAESRQPVVGGKLDRLQAIGYYRI